MSDFSLRCASAVVDLVICVVSCNAPSEVTTSEVVVYRGANRLAWTRGAGERGVEIRGSGWVSVRFESIDALVVWPRSLPSVRDEGGYGSCCSSNVGSDKDDDKDEEAGKRLYDEEEETGSASDNLRFSSRSSLN